MPSMDPQYSWPAPTNLLESGTLPGPAPDVQTGTYPLAEGLFLEVTTVADSPGPAGPLEISVAFWSDGRTLMLLPSTPTSDGPTWDVLGLVRLVLDPQAEASPTLRFQVLLPGSHQEVYALQLGPSGHRAEPA